MSTKKAQRTLRKDRNKRGTIHHTTPIKEKQQKECPDEQKVNMFYKDGNSTMLFCRIPRIAAISLEAYIVRFLERKNTKLTGKFIIK